MDAINQLILLPAVQHQEILPFLIVFMLWLHLPFAGMALISSLLSLLFVRRDPDIARTFGLLIPIRIGTFLTFVLLPLLSLVVLFGQYLFHQPIPVSAYLLRIVPFLLIGFFLLGVYQRSLQPLAGLCGALCAGTGTFFLINTLDLVAYPQKWEFITSLLPFVFSITGVIHFKIFLAASTMLTGAAALFFLFRWPERRLPEDSPLRGKIRSWSLGLLMAGSLALPLLMVWDLYTMSDTSLSAKVFAISFIQLLLLLFLAAWGLSMLRHACHRHAVACFVTALVVLGLFIYRQEQFQSLANRETLIVLAQDSAKALDELQSKREALYAKAGAVDVKLGEKIYNERCSACHRFDQKIVGPPYNNVLPKYKGDPEKLAAFIRNPVKVDPGYPPMPNQGLNETEVKSVAAFLLAHLAGEK
jgi:cytochrome c551/c552